MQPSKTGWTVIVAVFAIVLYRAFYYNPNEAISIIGLNMDTGGFALWDNLKIYTQYYALQSPNIDSAQSYHEVKSFCEENLPELVDVVVTHFKKMVDPKFSYNRLVMKMKETRLDMIEKECDFCQAYWDTFGGLSDKVMTIPITLKNSSTVKTAKFWCKGFDMRFRLALVDDSVIFLKKQSLAK